MLIRDQDPHERRQLSERLQMYDIFMCELPVKFWNKQFKCGRIEIVDDTQVLGTLLKFLTRQFTTKWKICTKPGCTRM
jgi:hypothetical protein